MIISLYFFIDGHSAKTIFVNSELDLLDI